MKSYICMHTVVLDKRENHGKFYGKVILFYGKVSFMVK